MRAFATPGSMLSQQMSVSPSAQDLNHPSFNHYSSHNIQIVEITGVGGEIRGSGQGLCGCWLLAAGSVLDLIGHSPAVVFAGRPVFQLQGLPCRLAAAPRVRLF